MKGPLDYRLMAHKREASLIDANTAEIRWCYLQVQDPYGEELDLPPEYCCVGREYFARRPDSDIWVSFRDLPEATRVRLQEKQSAGDLEEDDEIPW
jgi:hypothetical protein